MEAHREEAANRAGHHDDVHLPPCLGAGRKALAHHGIQLFWTTRPLDHGTFVLPENATTATTWRKLLTGVIPIAGDLSGQCRQVRQMGGGIVASQTGPTPVTMLMVTGAVLLVGYGHLVEVDWETCTFDRCNRSERDRHIWECLVRSSVPILVYSQRTF